MPFLKLHFVTSVIISDEEFLASVTCLFSTNALSFMLLDGLADVAEYTSKRVIHLVEK
jgi:hypothetical protein